MAQLSDLYNTLPSFYSAALPNLHLNPVTNQQDWVEGGVNPDGDPNAIDVNMNFNKQNTADVASIHNSGLSGIDAIMRASPNMTAHEAEHALQVTSGRHYNPTDGLAGWYQNAMQGMRDYPNYHGNVADDTAKALARTEIDGGLKDRLTKLLGYSPTYLGDGQQTQRPLAEQWAELSSLDAKSHKQLEDDQEVFARMFQGNEALRAAFKASTGLRTTRLDAKDLTPFETDPNYQAQGPYHKSIVNPQTLWQGQGIPPQPTMMDRAKQVISTIPGLSKLFSK